MEIIDIIASVCVVLAAVLLAACWVDLEHPPTANDRAGSNVGVQPAPEALGVVGSRDSWEVWADTMHEKYEATSCFAVEGVAHD